MYLLSLPYAGDKKDYKASKKYENIYIGIKVFLRSQLKRSSTIIIYSWTYSFLTKFSLMVYFNNVSKLKLWYDKLFSILKANKKFIKPKNEVSNFFTENRYVVITTGMEYYYYYYLKAPLY